MLEYSGAKVLSFIACARYFQWAGVRKGDSTVLTVRVRYIIKALLV